MHTITALGLTFLVAGVSCYKDVIEIQPGVNMTVRGTDNNNNIVAQSFECPVQPQSVCGEPVYFPYTKDIGIVVTAGGALSQNNCWPEVDAPGGIVAVNPGDAC